MRYHMLFDNGHEQKKKTKFKKKPRYFLQEND